MGLYALLEAYGRQSGVPVLLNTSFNLSGEPIVNRAVEGYSTFVRCGIDVLVAGQTRVMKRGSSAAQPEPIFVAASNELTSPVAAPSFSPANRSNASAAPSFSPANSPNAAAAPSFSSAEEIP